MSLDKAIISNKEHRTAFGIYKKNRTKFYDKTCRNNGSCYWCKKTDYINSKNQNYNLLNNYWK